MKDSKKRCACCHRWFQPDPRTAAFQKFCSRPDCRRQSRRLSHHTWWRNNGAETNNTRRHKLRAWAERVDYWRHYRAAHPGYTRRDNERRHQAHQSIVRAAKQDTRHQVSVGRLRDIQALVPENAAKQDMIHRRVEGIVDYLLWREGAAKQDSIPPAGSSA